MSGAADEVAAFLRELKKAGRRQRAGGQKPARKHGHPFGERASLADLSAQEFLVIKEPRVAGLSLGVDARGRPVAVLALPGVASVTLAATQAVVPGRPATIGLRLDGTTARLFVDGRPVAAEPCAIRPMDWFHDVTNGARSEKTTAITLGRSLSIGVSRFDLLGFRAFNVALSDAEMALLAPGNADLAGGR